MTAGQRSARPVSGEIMTGAAPAGLAAMRDVSEAVDAEFEVLPQFGRRAPEVQPEQQPASAVASLEGMGMLRKPEAAPARPATRGSPLFWAAGVAAVLAAFWVSGGHVLMRNSTVFAFDGDTSSLHIQDLTSRVDASGINPVLLVDGEAANDGGDAAALPPLAIHVTGNDGAVTLYTLGTSGRTIAPGQRFAFSSRLDVPRTGVRTVSVTFADAAN